jgi:hypothetical protein
MSLFGSIISKILNQQNFTDTAEGEKKKTLNEKISETISNILTVSFFFIYLTRIDKYIPNDEFFKTILKIVASTFLVLSVIGLVINIFEFIN